ncbi:DUF6894 family protein [Rhizobium tropici]|uniref:DUF6894 domain-containing protein n=1 Tax=Rhizobium tropici TaxID=398 RepID=A0A329YKV7_RHITR|nr:hypothetical protein [Rhizobium tropici]RAX41250.1 hypothetical protein DQ393_11825 [Rhizobium tropici]
MSKFLFQLLGQKGPLPVELEYNLATVEDAKRQARTALAEIARDGLPEEPLNMLAVEVFDHERRPIVELRLLLEEIPKQET